MADGGELARLRAERDVLDEKIRLLEKVNAASRQEHAATERAMIEYSERLHRTPERWHAGRPPCRMNPEGFGIYAATFSFVSDNRDNVILTERGPVISLVDLLPPRPSPDRRVDPARVREIYESVRSQFAFPLRLTVARTEYDSTYIRLKDHPHSSSAFYCDQYGNATFTVSYV